jgi:hypothetical protein
MAQKTKRDFFRKVLKTNKVVTYENRIFLGQMKKVKIVNVSYDLEGCGHTKVNNTPDKFKPKSFVVCDECAELEGYCF